MRTVLIVVFDGVQSLDLTGPLEVFAAASDWCRHRGGTSGYAITTASLGGRSVRTSSGLRLLPDADLRLAPPPDLLIVPGGVGARRRDPDLVAWLREHARDTTRLASVCTGAFLLAEAGLPPGRYVDRTRLEAARRHLEDTAAGVEQTARACGYGTPEAMRRAFVRALGVRPRRILPPIPSGNPHRGASCRSPSRSLTASPPSTRLDRTRYLRTCQGQKSFF